MGSRIGKVICTDRVTAAKLKVGYARLLIEIDLNKPLVMQFQYKLHDELHVQHVFYEGLPSYCCHCKVFSHNTSNCRAAQPKDGPAVNSDNATMNDVVEEVQADSSKAKDQGKFNDPGQIGNRPMNPTRPSRSKSRKPRSKSRKPRSNSRKPRSAPLPKGQQQKVGKDGPINKDPGTSTKGGHGEDESEWTPVMSKRERQRQRRDAATSGFDLCPGAGKASSVAHG